MKKIILPFIIALLLFSCKEEKKVVITEPVEIKEPEPVIAYGFNLDNFTVINDTIKEGESFGVIMDRHRVMYPKINEIATKIKDTFDVRRVRSGRAYTILASKDSLEKAQSVNLEFNYSPTPAKVLLDINNLSFSYSGKKEDELFNNLSFCIEKNDRIAIIGKKVKKDA